MFQGTSLLAAVLSGGELRPRPSDYLRVALLVCLLPIFSSFSWTQALVPTSRVDNTRSNADTQETILTPGNVNSATFGHLFSDAVDYVVMAQPLYVPNVNTGHGIHNVVYVVTQADSVYAFDADNGTQLWYASMLNNVGAGATTASGANLPCGTAAGFNQEGIIGTPAIDSATNTMYLVAKTALAGVVRHHLHALDITTGNEQPGSPVLIQATSTSNKGKKTVFNSLHQKNRPGLLLLNGVVYMGFGSNYCNDSDSGWVLGYDASSLAQLAVFNTSPDTGLTSIWQSGSGLTADESGYIFVETAEAGNNSYDIQNGGQTYCNSVLKLTPDLTVADFFTPALVPFLNSNDFDLSSTGAIVLPDQSGPYPHELVAGGKYGVVYVLNRDNLGMYSPSTDQIVQEITLVQQNPNALKDVLFGSPAYWNNTVYFAPDAAPIMAFPVSGGLLGNPPGTPIETAARYTGSHSPSISANGNANGILWVISGGLNAFDAVSLKLLYNSKQAPGGRDALGTVGHFVTQTVANGKVYVTDESQTTPIPIYALEAYGSSIHRHVHQRRRAECCWRFPARKSYPGEGRRSRLRASQTRRNRKLQRRLRQGRIRHLWLFRPRLGHNRLYRQHFYNLYCAAAGWYLHPDRNCGREWNRRRKCNHHRHRHRRKRLADSRHQRRRPDRLSRISPPQADRRQGIARLRQGRLRRNR